MKIFILLACVLSVALAEAPLGDGYPSARSSHGHNHEYSHSNDFQRSLSQEYGAPVARSSGTPYNAVSREYLPPNTRSGLSQTYGPPNARSGISEEYGVPSARSSTQYSSTTKGLSTEYGAPNARSGPSQTYGAPVARTGLSQEYGVPSVRSDAKTPSSQYGVSELRSPSEEYGAPSQRSLGGGPSQEYGVPAGRNSQSGIHSARSSNVQQKLSSPQSSAKSFASNNLRSFHGSSPFGARSLSSSYRPPATKRFSSYSRNAEPLSDTYRTPNQNDQSDSVEVPIARDLSQEYGVPASRAAHQKNSVDALSYSAAARSAPSNTYGAPLVRNSDPSEQYGAPDQRSNLSNEGYSYARASLDDILNQEPASYDFSYKVEDYESGSDFGHAETRQDNRAEGTYFVVLPDGTKQVVEYEADERGFKPRISVEPAYLARSAGYDDNAAELARSNKGPY